MFRAVTTITLMLVAPIAAIAIDAATDARQIQTWVDDLDDDEFAVREVATTKLIAARTTAALEAEVRTAESTCPEASWRATHILKAWQRSDYTETKIGLKTVIARWSAANDQRLVQLARSLTAKPQPSVQTEWGVVPVRFPLFSPS